MIPFSVVEDPSHQVLLLYQPMLCDSWNTDKLIWKRQSLPGMCVTHYKLQSISAVSRNAAMTVTKHPERLLS